MNNSLRMKLVFRLAGTGFSIPIEDVLEVRELLPGWLNRETADPGQFVLGTMMFRGEQLPVRDLRRMLRLSGAAAAPEQAVLVMAGLERQWAMVVEQIEGIFPEEEFRSREVPFKLDQQGQPLYQTVDIWRERPLVALEAAGFELNWDAA